MRIKATVEVPERCNAGCLFCDWEYSRFNGWCNLFQEALKMRGASKLGNLYDKCPACLNAERAGEK